MFKVRFCTKGELYRKVIRGNINTITTTTTTITATFPHQLQHNKASSGSGSKFENSSGVVSVCMRLISAKIQCLRVIEYIHYQYLSTEFCEGIFVALDHE